MDTTLTRADRGLDDWLESLHPKTQLRLQKLIKDGLVPDELKALRWVLEGIGVQVVLEEWDDKLQRRIRSLGYFDPPTSVTYKDDVLWILW